MGLVEDNVRLASRAALVAHRKYSRHLNKQVALPLNYEDWLSEMNLALVRSARGFSADRGQFKNYASRAMNNAVYSLWRGAIPHYHNCCGAAIRKEQSRVAGVWQPSSDALRMETKEYIEYLKAKADLTWIQRMVLVLIYKENMNGVEIAQVLSVSNANVTETHRRALSKLRQQMEES